LKLTLRGESYDLIEAVSEATMQTLKVLNVSSARSGGEAFPAVTPRTIQECFTTLAAKYNDPTFNQMELLDDIAFLSNMQGIVFLARRKRGDQITFDEAGDFAPSELGFEPDEEDAEEAAPKDQSAPDPS
jgi:hypothetical protein